MEYEAYREAVQEVAEAETAKEESTEHELGVHALFAEALA